MSQSSNSRSVVSNALKLYLFPSLVSILAMMIWRDVSELRYDVKQLLAQSNIDKTEIQNLKKDVDILNRQVFKTPATIASISHKQSLYIEHDQYFKHEDFYDINKYIPKNS
jgi:hypothetical protein